MSILQTCITNLEISLIFHSIPISYMAEEVILQIPADEFRSLRESNPQNNISGFGKLHRFPSLKFDFYQSIQHKQLKKNGELKSKRCFDRKTLQSSSRRHNHWSLFVQLKKVHVMIPFFFLQIHHLEQQRNKHKFPWKKRDFSLLSHCRRENLLSRAILAKKTRKDSVYQLDGTLRRKELFYQRLLLLTIQKKIILSILSPWKQWKMKNDLHSYFEIHK